MAGVKGKSGGFRPGGGRKPKHEEEKAKQIALNAICGLYGSLEEGMKALLQSGEGGLIKFVFEHAMGKPREKVDMDIEDHTVVWEEIKTYETNQKANASN